jgi:hypothetical protein
MLAGQESVKLSLGLLIGGNAFQNETFHVWRAARSAQISYNFRFAGHTPQRATSNFQTIASNDRYDCVGSQLYGIPEE